MKSFLLVGLAAFVLALSLGGHAQPEPPALLESGHFVLTFDGNVIGYEYFGFVRGADGTYELTSSSTHLYGDTANRLQSLKLDSEFRPVSYDRLWIKREDPSVQLQATFSGNTATLRTTTAEQTDVKTFTTSTEFALVDSGAVSQALILIKRLELVGTGAMALDVLNPLNGIVLTSTVREAGTATLHADGRIIIADEVTWNYDFNGEKGVAHLYLVDGRAVATLEENQSEPPFITYRGDLYPSGVQIEGF